MSRPLVHNWNCQAEALNSAVLWRLESEGAVVRASVKSRSIVVGISVARFTNFASILSSKNSSSVGCMSVVQTRTRRFYGTF